MIAWDLIADGDPANDELAKTIADELNNGHTLDAGIIPASTPIILYSLPGDVVQPPSAAFRLGQNYPNPVALSTRIPFAVPAEGVGAAVQVQVFDMSGRLVKTLVDASMPSGDHEILWDGLDDSGSPVSAGVYFYRMTAGSFSETRKLQILN